MFLLIFALFLPEVFLEEVDADGLLVVLGEDALAVALDHARLAHRTVPHDHHLKGKKEEGMKLDDDREGGGGGVTIRLIAAPLLSMTPADRELFSLSVHRTAFSGTRVSIEELRAL